MAQIRLCGYGEGEKVQLKTEVNNLGKKKAPMYVITKVIRPIEASEIIQECKYDIIPEGKGGVPRNNVDETELFQPF
jgi:hypothetical protein